MEQTLGRYKIVGELGRGAMGAVYRAVDPLIEREVAIKTLLPSLPPEVIAEVRERFLREARSAGRLNHPNIVTIYDVGESGGVAYIAMELLEGRSLSDLLRSGERLPAAQAAEIAAQVADALDHAQKFSIVHRDIKPANIMLDASGRAKLTDFGIARLPSSSMTQTGDALGSPKYMSPEQVLGQAIDPRADLFSLGIVLYEMLAGHHPFQRDTDTVFSLMHRIAAEAPLPLDASGRQVPPGLARIVAKALAKKPEARYPRAADMAAELRSWRGAGAGAQEEKTLVLKKEDKSKPAGGLLADLDLDNFAANFERAQQERARAEQEEQRRELQEQEERSRRWQFPQVDLTAEQEPRREAPRAAAPVAAAAAADTNPNRLAVLEHLKKQAAQAPREVPGNAQDKAIAKLDAAMREAERFLSQIAGQINSVHPATERPYDFLYLGRVPSVALSDAAFYGGHTEVSGRGVLASLKLAYKVAPAQPHTIRLHKDDIARCIHYLKARKTEYKALAERRNDFGQPIVAQVTVTGTLPCEVELEADYESGTVVIEVSGVRRIGRYDTEVRAERLNDAVDALVRYLLGVDDEFEKRLERVD